VIEALRDGRRQRRGLHQPVPPQKQVVVVERAVGLLQLHVAAEQALQLRLPFGAPRVDVAEHVREQHARVDRTRIDGEASFLAREAPLAGRAAELLTSHVHQVRRVTAVQHAEPRVESEVGCVFAQQAVRHRVERAGPRQLHALATPRIRQRLTHDASGAPDHFPRCAAAEGDEQYAARRHSGQDQMRDAMGQRQGLARACPGDDEQRTGVEPAAVGPGSAE
jgi:hypothetical protein